jgi:hypothetical protein
MSIPFKRIPKIYKEKNIAAYNQDGELVPVYIVSITQWEATVVEVNKKTGKRYLKQTDLVPLPITIPRLQKLQFHPEAGNRYRLNTCQVIPSNDSFIARVDGMAETIQYIHELQNFYRTYAGHALPLPFMKP